MADRRLTVLALAMSVKYVFARPLFQKRQLVARSGTCGVGLRFKTPDAIGAMSINSALTRPNRPARDTTVFIGIPCYNRRQGLARQILRCPNVEIYASGLSQSPLIA